MKKTFIVFFAAIIFSCNTAEKPEATESMSKPSSEAITNMSGYTPIYSASFEMGDPKQAEIVLELWRAWENGDLTPTKTHFADSIIFYGADGSVVGGSNLDSSFNMMQEYRNMYSSVQTEVYTIFPVKSTDKNENWVCAWGKEIHTDKSGKTDSMYLQETWRFNKDGKVNLLYQFMSPAAKASQ